MTASKSTEVSTPVRSRTTFTGDRVTAAHSASCPVQGTDVPLEECRRCSRNRGLHARADGSDLTLRCEVHPEDDVLAPSARRASHAGELTIAELMTTQVVCVRPEMTVQALRALLIRHGITGVPVVDPEGRPLGVVSSTDVLRYHDDVSTGQVPPDATVNDIMTAMAFCLPANESVAKAAALMAFENVHRIPVVSPSGKVVGLLSPLDVLRWLAREHGYVIANRS